MLFYATQFVVICYSSSRKLIQLPLLKGKSELLCKAFKGFMLSSPCLTAWLAYAPPPNMLYILNFFKILNSHALSYVNAFAWNTLSSLVCLANSSSFMSQLKQYLLCEAFPTSPK